MHRQKAGQGYPPGDPAPYDKAGLLDGLYREAKVESVEYAASIDVVAVCPPKVLGQVKDYVEGWREEREDWEL